MGFENSETLAKRKIISYSPEEKAKWHSKTKILDQHFLSMDFRTEE
jgi:hypothetical protein